MPRAGDAPASTDGPGRDGERDGSDREVERLGAALWGSIRRPLADGVSSRDGARDGLASWRGEVREVLGAGLGSDLDGGDTFGAEGLRDEDDDDELDDRLGIDLPGEGRLDRDVLGLLLDRDGVERDVLRDGVGRDRDVDGRSAVRRPDGAALGPKASVTGSRNASSSDEPAWAGSMPSSASSRTCGNMESLLAEEQ